MRIKTLNQSRKAKEIVATLNAMPKSERDQAMQDAVNAISRYVPAALDEGLGRRPSNEQIREFIATEGHHPEVLPDIILGGSDRALVREPDRSGYVKLVHERGSWYCGCGKSWCIHKAALQANLRPRGRA